jgi:hypothetical protein
VLRCIKFEHDDDVKNDDKNDEDDDDYVYDNEKNYDDH